GCDRLWVVGPVAGRVPSGCPASRHRGPSGYRTGGGALQLPSTPTIPSTCYLANDTV
ncbi:hypothetical protein ACLOJK_036725, partial [Asimina triloba]